METGFEDDAIQTDPKIHAAQRKIMSRITGTDVNQFEERITASIFSNGGWHTYYNAFLSTLISLMTTSFQNRPSSRIQQLVLKWT